MKPPEPPRIRKPAAKVIRDIVEIAAELCEVTPAEVLGSGRKWPVVKARHAAMAAAQQATRWSSVRLGRWFNRDHSSLLWALKRAEPAVVRQILRNLEGGDDA